MSKRRLVKPPNPTALKKARFLQALEAQLGIVSAACNVIGINRTTYYDWINKDESFRDSVTLLSETVKDFGESKLFELMNGVKVIKMVPDEKDPERKLKEVVYKRAPDTAAVIFFNKTRNKDRGYFEKVLNVNTEDKLITIEETRDKA